MSLNFKKSWSSRGDTIVEVLISMTILAVVLGTAYATTNRSFHAGLNSQYRNQALLVAQQQIELLKSADTGPSPTISTFQSPPYKFCINPSTLAKVPITSSSTPYCTTPVGTPPANASQYTLVDQYTPNPGNPVFTITVQWQNNNLTQNQVVLYYKASGSYVP